MKKPISFILILCMVLAMMPGMSITASAAAGDTFTANITVGGADVPCTFKVLTEQDGATPAAVQIGDGIVAAINTLTAGELSLPTNVRNDGNGRDYAVTAIGGLAFQNCSRLTGNLIIPNGVTTIGDSAFNSCSGFNGTLTIPNGVTSIGFRAFYHCNRLIGSLTIPASVTGINSWAFDGCSGFTGDLIIPAGINTINAGTFVGCSGFNGILTIPASVTSINIEAFYGCSNLTSAKLLGSTAPSVDNSFLGTYKFYVPQGATGYTSGYWNTKYGSRIVFLVNATAPVIASDLSTTQVEYNQDAAAAPLDATATATDGGIISYAWYSNTANSTAGATPLGSTIATYTPSTATAGTRYYYCVVTNTNNSVSGTKTTQTTSAIAKIKVNAPVNTAAQLAAALGSNATVSGNTVTLTGNVSDLACTIMIELSENITLDLDGHTISGTNGINPLKINSGTGTLTITGSGSIVGGSVELINAADAITISGGTVVIESGSIIGGISNYYSYGSCGDGIEMSSGSLIISGGAIKGGVSSNEYNYAGNGLKISGGTVTIYDGSFYSGTDHFNSSKAIYASSGTVAEIIAAGKIMKSYTNEGFTTGEATIANTTSLDALTSKYIKVQSPVVNAAAPMITNNLSTTQVSYNQNAAATALNATATVTDGGTVSYAWYSNTTNSTAGATPLGISNPTYTPSTATAGNTYYYCLVTNTNNTVSGTKNAQTTSAIANIKVNAPPAPPSNNNGGGSSSGGGGGSSTPTIVTKIESGEKVTGANVVSLVKEGKSLTVEGKAGEKLVFDTEALKNIDSQTKESVKVDIKDVSSEHKSQQPGKIVFSLTITAGSKNISSFGNGTATISLPYELKSGEKAEDVTVWYLAEDGTMSEVPCRYDPATKLATFKVNHFSLYVVGTADTSLWKNPFSDVKKSSWFYDAVRYVSANGLMQGTEDTLFNPGAKTTRGMIVTILWRMENEPKSQKEITFTDVKSGKYYHDAVAWASEKGIVSGYSTELFAPGDSITREQLAVILYNYAASKGYKTDNATDLSIFSDSGKVHSWSKDAIRWANAEGLINGTVGNLLDPVGAAQRSQVAATLQRFMENVKK